MGRNSAKQNIWDKGFILNIFKPTTSALMVALSLAGVSLSGVAAAATSIQHQGITPLVFADSLDSSSGDDASDGFVLATDSDTSEKSWWGASIELTTVLLLGELLYKVGADSMEDDFDYEIDGFEAADAVRYEVFYDDVSFGTTYILNTTTAGSPSGTEIINVPGGGTNVRITLGIKQNGADDYAGFDNFRVYE